MTDSHTSDPSGQRGAIRISALINILLGVGILIAIVVLLFINLREEQVVETTPAYAPQRPSAISVPAKPNVDDLKSRLEIETLKLERLRIQTERVQAQQRRDQSVQPSR